MAIEGGGNSKKPRYGLVLLKREIQDHEKIRNFGLTPEGVYKSDIANLSTVNFGEHLKSEPLPELPKHTLKQRFLRSIFLSKDYPKPMEALNYKADYVELNGGEFSYSVKSVPVVEEIKSTIKSSETWLSKVFSGGSYVHSETPEQIAKAIEGVGKGASKAGKFAMVGLSASAALGAIVGGVAKQTSHAEKLATQRQISGLGLADQPALSPVG